jgi:hypothetical protein
LSSAGRTALIEIFLRIVSDPVYLETPDSPHNFAMIWIIELDPLYLCPQDNNLIQRYVMAVFYFSTRGGGRWSQCSAPAEFDDPEAVESANLGCDIIVPGGKSDAWLTPSLECDWGGVACNDDDFLKHMDFGKNQPEKDYRHTVFEILCFANFSASSLLFLPKRAQWSVGNLADGD